MTQTSSENLGARGALALALVSIAISGFAWGCSSSNGMPGDNGNDAGQDHPGQGQDTGGGTCPARPDLPSAAPACTTLANNAQAIPFTALSGAAPTPAGGAIQDGVYVSTRTGTYGGTGFGRRITFAITEGATRMFWAGEVLDATGATVMTSFRADTAIAVTGTRINFTPTCVSTQPSPLPPALDFTVSGQDLVLSAVPAGSTPVAETRYTRVGCTN